MEYQVVALLHGVPGSGGPQYSMYRTGLSGSA